MKLDQKLKIARVVRLVRFSLQMGQVDFAREHGLTQSTLSKVENGTSEITIGFYRDLKKKYGIQEIEFDLGILDKSVGIKKPEDLKKEVRSFYEIPAVYSENCASSTRTSLPLISFFKENYGQKEWVRFLKSKRFNEKADLYFYDLNNRINIQFNLDLLKEILRRNPLNKNIYQDLCSYSSLPLCHGLLSSLYRTRENPMDLMRCIIQNISKYDLSASYELREVKRDKLFLEVKPRRHLLGVNFLDNNFGDFVGLYNKHYFENFSLICKTGKLKVELSQGYGEAQKWLYEISCGV